MTHVSRSRSDPSRSVPPVSGEFSRIKADLSPRVARTHIAAKDEAAEDLLLTLISQRESRPDLLIRRLRAQAVILKLDEKRD